MTYGSNNFYSPLPIGYEEEAWQQYWQDEQAQLEEERHLRKTIELPDGFPMIVCLCGSTEKAYEAFAKANLQQTLARRIVLTIGVNEKDSALGITAGQKHMLDELHKQKIYISDLVFVLNVGGYFGVSTHSEIMYARGQGILVRYLEQHPYTCITCGSPLPFVYAFEYDGNYYCRFDLPEYSKDSQNW